MRTNHVSLFYYPQVFLAVLQMICAYGTRWDITLTIKDFFNEFYECFPIVMLKQNHRWAWHLRHTASPKLISNRRTVSEEMALTVRTTTNVPSLSTSSTKPRIHSWLHNKATEKVKTEKRRRDTSVLNRLFHWYGMFYALCLLLCCRLRQLRQRKVCCDSTGPDVWIFSCHRQHSLEASVDSRSLYIQPQAGIITMNWLMVDLAKCIVFMDFV